MYITIDCGHNAKPFDTGAVGYVNEEVEVRMIGLALQPLLEAAGHEVQLLNITKCKSLGDSLSQRCKASDEYGTDLFISLHLNASANTKRAMGTETFAASFDGKGSIMASAIEQSIVKLGFKSRGAKVNPKLYVLKHTSCAAVLVEAFFVDSLADYKLYLEVTHQKIAQAIADGVSIGFDLWSR